MQSQFIRLTPKEALEKFQKLKDSYFSTEMLQNINAWFERHRDTPLWRQQRLATRGAVESLIYELGKRQAINDQPLEVQYYLWERFYYMERALSEMRENCDYPHDSAQFLRQGLIELWRLREQRGLFD